MSQPGWVDKKWGDNSKEIWYSEGVTPQTQAKYRANSPTGIKGTASILDIAARQIVMYDNGHRTHYMF